MSSPKAQEALRVLQKRLAGYRDVRTQLLDVNQANKLSNTLRHLKLFDTPALRAGDTLPPAYHQIYFTPELSESELAEDGGDPTFNPPTYTRRMWAGGELSWRGDNRLRIGEEVEEVTTFDRIEAKRTKGGEDMLVCWAKKRYSNDRGLALEDKRSWLFRAPAPANSSAGGMTAAVPAEEGNSTDVGATLRDGVERLGTYTTSEVLLFRFSALTFNAHRIHYDADHTRQAEGHPRLLVHAPLNVLLLANMWHGAFGEGPRQISYRAMSPCYVGLRNEVGVDRINKTLTIERQGTVMMQARGAR